MPDAQEADGDVHANASFAKVLGQELKRRREEAGHTRPTLVARLPSGIADRTLLTYEHGIRQITVERLIEITRALDVPAWEVLKEAMEKAADLTMYSFTINLRQVVKDRQRGYEAVRAWAGRRLNDGGDGTHEVLLTPATRREMAAMLGVSHKDLSAYLMAFSQGGLR